MWASSLQKVRIPIYFPIHLDGGQLVLVFSP
jgi:hypothetical protein